MRLIIQHSPENVGLWTARHIAQSIQQHQSTDPSRPFVLGLPTGSTPLPTYAHLVAMVDRGELSFANVVTFNMDEYVGLPESHRESYHSFMWNNLFSKIDIRPENVHILNGNAPDLKEECQRFEDAIVEAGGIDLFLGGVGNDGHIAFNEPFSSFQSRTRIIALTQDTIEANSRFFEGRTDLVPRRALTVGVGTLLDARQLVILATGPAKSHAVRQGVEGPLSHVCPLSALQLHQDAILLVDTQSAQELSAETRAYFLEHEAEEIL